MVFIALAAEAVLLLLRVPLKRDLNGDGIVTAEENAEVDELSRKVRRRIIVGTVVFAIPCIVMTAGSIGSAQAGVQDGCTASPKPRASLRRCCQALRITPSPSRPRPPKGTRKAL
ncbi:MAG: hypothetical protein ACLU0O_11395 [Collinsella sp.]